MPIEQYTRPTIAPWQHCTGCDRPRVWLEDNYYCVNRGYCARAMDEATAAQKGKSERQPCLTWPEIDRHRYPQPA